MMGFVPLRLLCLLLGGAGIVVVGAPAARRAAEAAAEIAGAVGILVGVGRRRLICGPGKRYGGW